MVNTKLNKLILAVCLCILSFQARSQCTAEFSYTKGDTGRTVTFTNLSVVTPPVFYYWDYGDGSPIDTSENGYHHYNLDTVYQVCLSVVDSGCSDTFCALINICSNDCVWPGDANDDGVANAWDILKIGVAYNNMGPDRPDITGNWEGKYGTDWATSFANLQNHKYADCNGSGLVNLVDVESIIDNYGMVHNKGGNQGGSSGAVNLMLAMDKDSVGPGDSVNVDILLGDDITPATNIYGLAFCISYNTALVDSTSFKIDFTGSWLGTSDSTISISRDDYGGGQVDVGLVRKNKKNKDGKGKVASGSFFIEDNIDGKVAATWVLNLNICNIVVIDKDENIINVGTVSDSILIAGVDGPMDRKNLIDRIRIYPNPVKQEINISIENLMANEITISNLLGQEVYQTGDRNHLYNIDVSNIERGVYFLSVTCGEDVIVKKVVITK